MNTQEQLNNAYQPLVDRTVVYERLGQTPETDSMLRELNGPFLIAADQEYEASKRKVMIVGMENYGWIDAACTYYDFISTKTIEDALAVYRGFNIADYGAPFGKYFAMFRDRIIGATGTNNRRAVHYSNLFKLNQFKLHMIESPYLEQVLTLQQNIFQQEIKILAPQILIFLTGPDYDHIIRRFYPDVVFSPFNGYTDRQLAVVSAAGLPSASFRTYHPGFVNRDRANRLRFYDTIIERAMSIDHQ